MAIYWVGLTGPFLLDDTPNLLVISQLPANPTLADILYLASTGFAGILGRSVSVFSFLLQHESWPNPYNFKFVNLLLHLLNGCLLTLCCIAISKQWRQQAVSGFAFLSLSFIWLAHPIQVSTVLYVVQRMTLLSTMFSLMAILAYLAGRQLIHQERLKSGLFVMVAGLTLFTALAVISKENGVLVFLYVLVLEFTLFADAEQAAVLRKFRRVLLTVTIVVGLLGLLLTMPSTLEGYELKPFSFQERVLTQFPVLLIYIANIALLMPNYFGVFHDDLATAQGPLLWISMVMIVGLIALAFIKRRQWPLFAFAVLWFFAGHALESTFLPLEYYFEHRNYLPLLGPVFAVVIYFNDILPRLQSVHRNTVLVVLTIALLFMSFITVRQTTLWGNGLEQAIAAAEQHPYSPRAQFNLVEKLSADGQFQAAFDYHMSVIEPQQISISPYIRWLEFSCLLPGIEFPEDEVLRSQASQSPHDYGAVFSLNNLVFGVLENRCPSAPISKLQLVLEQLVSNANFAVSEADLEFYQALLQAAAGNFPEAAASAADSFQLRPDVRVGIYQVNWLIRSDQIISASEILQTLEADYAEDIAASADLSARVQFLRSRLENL